MTLKECIDMTIGKHPTWNPTMILSTYFALGPEAQKEAAKRKTDHLDKAFTSKARGYIKQIGKVGVINEIKRELNLPNNWTGTYNELISEYSKAYENNMKKSPVNKSIKITNISSYEDVETVIKYLKDSGASYDEILNIFLNAYNTNPGLQVLANDAREKMLYKGKFYIDKINDMNYLLDNLITYVNSYYRIDEQEDYYSVLCSSLKRMNEVVLAGYSFDDAASIIKAIFYGEDHPELSRLRGSIGKEEIKIGIIRNALQASILSTDIYGISEKENMLYEGMTTEQIMDCLEYIRNNLIVKLAGEGKITPEKLKANIENINESEVMFLAQLYMKLRRNRACTDVVESAKNRMYKLNNMNADQYQVTSELLNCIESKAFFDCLNSDYHI